MSFRLSLDFIYIIRSYIKKAYYNVESKYLQDYRHIRHKILRISFLLLLDYKINVQSPLYPFENNIQNNAAFFRFMHYSR
jgi:hypothetical protein